MWRLQKIKHLIRERNSDSGTYRRYQPGLPSSQARCPYHDHRRSQAQARANQHGIRTAAGERCGIAGHVLKLDGWDPVIRLANSRYNK
jgi:hypothetical protein